MKTFVTFDKNSFPEITKQEQYQIEKLFGISISNISPIDGGIMNHVYKINDKYVLKKVNPIYNKKRIVNAIEFQSQLSKQFNSIVKVYKWRGTSHSTIIGDYLFYISEYIKGNDVKSQNISNIINLIKVIHKSNFFKNEHIKEKDTLSQIIKKDLKNIRLKVLEFSEINLLVITLYEELENSIGVLIKEMSENHFLHTFSALHGDPNLKNIIIKAQKPYLFDFDRAKFGHAAEDWGRLLSSVGLMKNSTLQPKSIHENLYNEKLIYESIEQISKKRNEMKGLLQYSQFYTYRRSMWEILQAPRAVGQNNFDQLLLNTRNKITQLAKML